MAVLNERPSPRNFTSFATAKEVAVASDGPSAATPSNDAGFLTFAPEPDDPATHYPGASARSSARIGFRAADSCEFYPRRMDLPA
jgi:hypothetical protein